MWSPRLLGVRCVCVYELSSMLHAAHDCYHCYCCTIESRDHYNDVYVSGTIGECELVYAHDITHSQYNHTHTPTVSHPHTGTVTSQYHHPAQALDTPRRRGQSQQCTHPLVSAAAGTHSTPSLLSSTISSIICPHQTGPF